MNTEEYLQIDEVDNLIDNLEMVAYFLTLDFTYKWKWVIIALHQALYGALIAALQGIDPSQTVVDHKKTTGKTVKFHVKNEQIASKLGENKTKTRKRLTEPYLISLDEALRRMKRNDRPPNERLITTQKENNAIKKLTKEFRNEFEHFFPQSWMISKDIFPPIVKHVMRVIEFLACDSTCINMSIEQEERTRLAVKRIKNLVSL